MLQKKTLLNYMSGALLLKCPICNKGKLFKKYLVYNKQCQHCHKSLEGYHSNVDNQNIVNSPLNLMLKFFNRDIMDKASLIAYGILMSITLLSFVALLVSLLRFSNVDRENDIIGMLVTIVPSALSYMIAFYLILPISMSIGAQYKHYKHINK